MVQPLQCPHRLASTLHRAWGPFSLALSGRVSAMGGPPQNDVHYLMPSWA